MKRFQIFLTMAAIALTAAVPAAKADKQWQSLFDGKTLDGWTQRGGKAKYTVENGEIVGTTVLNTPNSFLCTDKMYSDFILEVEFLVADNMNSGIQIRSNSYKDYKNYRVHGYQVEIDPSSRAWSGGIYDEARRGWLFPLKDKPAAQKAFKNGQWNHYRIEAIGDRIRTWVNGVPAADLTDDMTSIGFIALQVHSSKTAGTQIKWRNIRIKDLAAKRGQPYLKTLIIDGQNNHNWRETTPVLKQILEDTALFSVDVATTPGKGEPMDSFKPDFSKYDVVVANYTGDSWPAQTQKSFVEYMKNGGGLVVYHAADNAFPNWQEWNEMIGVGGWGGRDEKSGPMVRYRDGKVVFDHSPGRGGTHGPQHEFKVVARMPDHPILKGLPQEWTHCADELYSKLRGPAKNLSVLATAYADPEKRGTGENEPILMTIDYGKGRVFHTVLGHAGKQLHSVGCIVTLQRGAEWAATGSVTQHKVPEDFTTGVSMRPDESTYKQISQYDFGKSREALAAIRAEIRSVPIGAYDRIEASLLEQLDAPGITYAGKQFVCRMLRRVGSAKSVPALTIMLADKELSHMARFALQHMPAPEAGAALRTAMGQLKGDLLAGVIGSLGQRGENKAVEEIAKAAASTNYNVANAAVMALGRIGTPDAAAALAKISVSANLASLKDNSLLMCADNMVESDPEPAIAIYRKLSKSGSNTAVKIAAYQGLIKADPQSRVSTALTLLKSNNVALKQSAGKFIAELEGSGVTIQLGQQLKKLEPETKAVLLAALESRADKAAAPYVAEEVSSRNDSVRLAAVQALGVVGTADEVELLARTSTQQGEIGKAAMASLGKITGRGVSKKFAQVAVGKAPVPVRVNAIESIIDRNDAEAVDSLLEAAADDDTRVRAAAYKAIGQLGGPREVRSLAKMLVETNRSSARAAMKKALRTIVARLENPDASPIIAAMSKADAEGKAALLEVLPEIGDSASLAAVRSQLDSDNAEVKKAAVRALAQWPNSQPLDKMLDVAAEGDDAATRILALRGYIKLISLPSNRSSAESVKLLEKAMQIAERTQEKRTVLGALPNYPGPEAIALAQKARSDTALAAEAVLAIKKIKSIMANKKLQVSASRNSGSAKNAIDGDRATRWDTGRGMTPGDWFMVDLGVESTVEGLTLDAAGSPGDYPRGYEVYVSFGGSDWGKPVVTGKSNKPVTEIEFQTSVKARFIKIVQTGRVPNLFWSIHELKVHFD